jgi:hypothetical protein
MVAPLEVLAKLGIDEDTAWTLAERQTIRRLPPLPTLEQLKTDAVAFENQEYGASLLVRLTDWSNLSAKVGPELFVTAVSDQFVFVGIMPDGAGFEKFRKTVADDCKHQQRCVSPNMYRYREGGGGWPETSSAKCPHPSHPCQSHDRSGIPSVVSCGGRGLLAPAFNSLLLNKSLAESSAPQRIAVLQGTNLRSALPIIEIVGKSFLARPMGRARVAWA